jgi:hypothetical protein
VEKLKDGKLTVCGSELDARSLEGDEEIKFLEKTKEEMEKRRQSTRNKKGRKGMPVYIGRFSFLQSMF